MTRAPETILETQRQTPHGTRHEATTWETER